MALRLNLVEPKNDEDLKDFTASLRSSLWRHWLERMPESAQLGDSGVVIVRFEVDRGEPIAKISVEQSPGEKLKSLTNAALGAVRDSTKSPHFPDRFKSSSIELRAIFFYNQPADSVKH